MAYIVNQQRKEDKLSVENLNSITLSFEIVKYLNDSVSTLVLQILTEKVQSPLHCKSILDIFRLNDEIVFDSLKILKKSNIICYEIINDLIYFSINKELIKRIEEE